MLYLDVWFERTVRILYGNLEKAKGEENLDDKMILMPLYLDLVWWCPWPIEGCIFDVMSSG